MGEILFDVISNVFIDVRSQVKVYPDTIMLIQDLCVDKKKKMDIFLQ